MTDTSGSETLEIVDCLKTIGLDGTLQGMDTDGMCLMEIDDFHTVKGHPWASLWPVESRSLVGASVQQAVNGKVARFNAECPTAKGTMKSWEVSVSPIRDADGTVIAIQSLSHDVTRREHDRRENAIVSKELSHRIKNLFAVVDSLIHLSARSEAASQPFIDGLRERLRGLGRAIAYIHPMNAQDVQTAPRTLKGLICTLLAPYEVAGADIVVTGDDADVSQDAVTSVAMILNELATNAVKYGAMKDGTGRLSVTLTKNAEHIVLLWQEQSLTASGPSKSPGFGTSLLDRTVRSQLRGTIEREWLDEGLLIRLQIPLHTLADG